VDVPKLVDGQKLVDVPKLLPEEKPLLLPPQDEPPQELPLFIIPSTGC
jgi:hypothetical protein